MTTHERTMFVAVGSILVSAALIIFVFWPMLLDYRLAKLNLQAREQEVAELEQRQSDLIALQAEFDSQSAKIDRMKLAVPSSAHYPEMVAQLSGLSERSQVKLTSVQPARTNRGTNELGVTLSAQGTFEQMVGFAERIEKNLRPMRVISMNMVDSSDSQTQNQLTATLNVVLVQAEQVGGDNE